VSEKPQLVTPPPSSGFTRMRIIEVELADSDTEDDSEGVSAEFEQDSENVVVSEELASTESVERDSVPRTDSDAFSDMSELFPNALR